MTDSVGARLRRLRKERQISRREIAEILGCSVGTVGHIETGIRLPTLRQIAMVAGRFGVSVDALIAGADLAGDRRAG